MRRSTFSFILLPALLALSFISTVSAAPATSAKKHAAVDVISIAVAPVVHPKRTFKQTIGVVLMSGELGIDVVHALTYILDNGTAPPSTAPADEAKVIGVLHVPFHAVNSVVGKVDTGVEAAEFFLFGISN